MTREEQQIRAIMLAGMRPVSRKADVTPSNVRPATGPRNSPWIGVPSVVAPPSVAPTPTPSPQPEPRTGWLGRERGAGSDIAMQLASGLMGVGQGLLSSRPGEGFGPGLARGMELGSGKFLETGRNQRSAAARRYYKQRAREGGPNAEMFGFMADLDAGQAANLFSQVRGQDASAGVARLGRQATDRRHAIGQLGTQGRHDETQRALQDRWEAGRADPDVRQKEQVALIEMAEHDQPARDALVEMGLMPEEHRLVGSGPVPAELVQAAEQYRKMSQQRLMLDDVFRKVRANQAGSTTPPPDRQ